MTKVLHRSHITQDNNRKVSHSFREKPAQINLFLIWLWTEVGQFGPATAIYTLYSYVKGYNKGYLIYLFLFFALKSPFSCIKKAGLQITNSSPFFNSPPLRLSSLSLLRHSPTPVCSSSDLFTSIGSVGLCLTHTCMSVHTPYVSLMHFNGTAFFPLTPAQEVNQPDQRENSFTQHTPTSLSLCSPPQKLK